MSPFYPNMALNALDDLARGGGSGNGGGQDCCGKGCVWWYGCGCGCDDCSSSCSSSSCCSSSCKSSCSSCQIPYDECFLWLGKVIDDTNISRNCSCRCRCCICGGWCGAGCVCVRCGNVCIDNCDQGDCCCRKPRGRICIRKVSGGKGGPVPLPCAVFQLQDAKCRCCGIGVTDDDGIVCFECLRNGTYFLREIQAPAGYQLNPDVTTITLTPFENQIFLEITNGGEYGSGSITVTAREYGKGIVLIPGVKFQLVNSMGTAYGTLVTDADGRATFANLPFDTYTLYVLEAPLGLEIPPPTQVTISQEIPSIAMGVTFNPLVAPVALR